MTRSHQITSRVSHEGIQGLNLEFNRASNADDGSSCFMKSTGSQIVVTHVKLGSRSRFSNVSKVGKTKYSNQIGTCAQDVITDLI